MSDVEAEQEGEWDELTELVHVDADLLKAGLDLLVMNHPVPVGEADGGVEETEGDQVLPYPLHHTPPPDGE